MKNYIAIMASLGLLVGSIGSYNPSLAKVFIQEQKKNYKKEIIEINSSITTQMKRYEQIYTKLTEEKEKYCENYDPRYTDYLDYYLQNGLDTDDENYMVIRNNLLCEQYAKESEFIFEIYAELKEGYLRNEEIIEMSEKKLQEKSRTLEFMLDELKLNIKELKNVADKYELILKEE